MTADCVTLWIGEALGPVERACLRSMTRQGHSVALYCYGEPEGVPENVEVRDASQILAFENLLPLRERPQVYSDWFRYELLQRGLGTWVDTDLYLVAPFDTEQPYLFGIEEGRILNNAILRVPADSPMLGQFLEPFRDRTTPRWMPWRQYIPARLHQLLTGSGDLGKIPWGVTGPRALTYLTRKFRLEHLAEPRERFYPVRWQQAGWILDPKTRLEDVISDGTVAVHLWNRCISHFKNDPAPPGSFLHRLQQEGS